MTGSWPDAARALHAEYRKLWNQPMVPDVLVEQRQRELAEMVPHLLNEIAKRDMVLTRVRQLLGGSDGLLDRGPDETVTVAQLRAALDGEGADRG